MDGMQEYRTSRLIVRRFRQEDLEDLFRYLSDPDVVRYEPYHTMSYEEVNENLQWRITAKEMWGVECIEDKKLIGNLYISEQDFSTIELGFVFHKDYQGRGFAKEACNKVLEILFEKDVHRIFAHCDPQNEPSWRLLEALGFSREGHLKKNVYFWTDSDHKPIWKDTYIYSKLKDCY